MYEEMKAGYLEAEFVPFTLDGFLETLVTGGHDGLPLEKYMELYSLDFPWRTYRVGLVEFDRGSVDAGTGGKVRSLIDDYVSGNYFGYTFYIDKYIGILFRNVSPLSLPRILRVLQEKVRDSFGMTVSVSIGVSVDSARLIPRSYSHAVSLLGQKFLYGHKQIIIRTEEDEKREAGVEYNSGMFLEDISCAMSVNNVVAVNNLLEEMKNQQISGRLDEHSIRSNYTGLYLSIVDKLDEGCSSTKELAGDKLKVVEEMGRKSSLQELHGFMKFKLLLISEAIGGKPRQECIIDMMLSYIERNFTRDIRLEGIAELFDYNSTYLGKLFRSRTGQYFNTYLDRLRVEKAKLFLKEGFKVYQVAEKVGIGDIDYFHKKFKKYTGLSPSAFKGKGQ